MGDLISVVLITGTIMYSSSINRISSALFGFIVLISFALNAEAVFMVGGQKSLGESVTVPNDIKSSQVGDFVAPLNEQQVRGLLITELQAQAAVNEREQARQTLSVIELLQGANDPSTPLGHGILSAIDATSSFWLEVGKVFDQLAVGQGSGGFLKMLGMLVIALVTGRVFEWVCLRQLQLSTRSTNLVSEVTEDVIKGEIEEGATAKVIAGSPFATFLKNLVGLGLFAIVSYIVAGLVTPADSVTAMFVNRLLASILIFRFFCFVFKFLLFPAPHGLSLIDGRISHAILYFCMAGFTFFYTFGTTLINLFVEHGLPTEHTVLAVMFLFGLIVNPIVFWFIWTQRYDVDRILFGTKKQLNNQSNQQPYPYAARAAIWPSAVTFIILLAFFNWQIQALTGNMERQFAIEIAWWITLIFPIADLLVSSLLYKLAALDIFQTAGFKRRQYRVTYFIRSVIRLLMLTILTLSFLEGWGFQALEKLSSSGGASIISSTIDIGVTIVLGFIIWEGIQLVMERHLPEEAEAEDSDEIEGEGGGIAATRSATLLPLFRTILLILLSAIVITSVLYSLGVQIGPLLAGASVVGIAIGFGSQKLVQDIISGMFFLIDDAFRRGEYVEVADLRGTIEKLSMRSMRLRHHLGAVQTIPYGEINTVKNLSRDWVTMKLELRLPYDVDIEKVRKVIKKVGQMMMQDEVTGPSMLAPLKSQGVMRVEESALIIRMKFTAKPGEQWVVRRVAYTNVRDALAEAGIQFAHREIKVRMPAELEALQKREFQNKMHDPEHKTGSEVFSQPGDQLTSVASAAAMSAVLASELAKQEKLDDDGSSGEDQ
jgi:small-conductance mechanosensitive channel